MAARQIQVAPGARRLLAAEAPCDRRMVAADWRNCCSLAVLWMVAAPVAAAAGSAVLVRRYRAAVVAPSDAQVELPWQEVRMLPKAVKRTPLLWFAFGLRQNVHGFPRRSVNDSLQQIVDGFPRDSVYGVLRECINGVLQ